jgi:hypothetical protein
LSVDDEDDDADCSSAPTVASFDWAICLEPTSWVAARSLLGCCHQFCATCLADYLENKIQDAVTELKCPDLACAVSAESYELEALISLFTSLLSTSVALFHRLDRSMVRGLWRVSLITAKDSGCCGMPFLSSQINWTRVPATSPALIKGSEDLL